MQLIGTVYKQRSAGVRLHGEHQDQHVSGTPEADPQTSAPFYSKSSTLASLGLVAGWADEMRKQVPYHEETWMFNKSHCKARTFHVHAGEWRSAIA